MNFSDFLHLWCTFTLNQIYMCRSILPALALISVLACSPLGKYRSLPEVRAWDKEIRQFEELDIKETYPENAIIFAGSSSIKLWTTLKKDMAPYPVIQRGYGGAKLSDFAVYAGRIFNTHPCQAIVIFIANDITGGKQDKEPQEVARLFGNVLNTVRKSHRTTPVFWIEITPTPLRWKVWPEQTMANNLVKRICENHNNTYFIQTDTAFLSMKGYPKGNLFRPDSLHLNERGYEVWTSIIKKALGKVVAPARVSIIGHRGASYKAPENTVASAKLAWELNADGVEVDIHLSKDNKIMVSHDANTKRTSGESCNIRDTDSDILRKLDVGRFRDPRYKGEKIPFLDEIIETVPDKKELVIEIKCGSEIIPRLKEIPALTEKSRKFTFISFDFQTISDTKKAFPGLSCYWLCSDPAMLDQNLGKVKDSGLDGVSLNFGIIDEKTAAAVKKSKLELYAWTVDDPAEAKRLISLGVKGITTNRPGWLDQEINK
jgi:glycerophosphoryl diester phosphodiesterase